MTGACQRAASSGSRSRSSHASSLGRTTWNPIGAVYEALVEELSPGEGRVVAEHARAFDPEQRSVLGEVVGHRDAGEDLRHQLTARPPHHRVAAATMNASAPATSASSASRTLCATWLSST